MLKKEIKEKVKPPNGWQSPFLESLFFRFILFYVYECFCLPVCAAPGATGQKRTSDPLDHSCKPPCGWVLGTEPRSSVRARAPNHRASLQPLGEPTKSTFFNINYYDDDGDDEEGNRKQGLARQTRLSSNSQSSCLTGLTGPQLHFLAFDKAELLSLIRNIPSQRASMSWEG